MNAISSPAGVLFVADFFADFATVGVKAVGSTAGVDFPADLPADFLPDILTSDGVIAIKVSAAAVLRAEVDFRGERGVSTRGKVGALSADGDGASCSGDLITGGEPLVFEESAAMSFFFGDLGVNSGATEKKGSRYVG